MRIWILIAMGTIVTIGIAMQSIVGIIAGIIIASSVGIIYAFTKKDKKMKKWTVTIFILSIVCLMVFYACLINSNM